MRLPVWPHDGWRRFFINYHSLLNPIDDALLENVEEPAYFHDLNLDQIMRHIIAGRDSYRLTSYFYHLPTTVDETTYRQQVMADIERPSTRTLLVHFSTEMESTRNYFAQEQKAYFPRQKQALRLHGLVSYCNAVHQLAANLLLEPFQSAGLKATADYLTDYAASSTFTDLASNSQALEHQLSSIEYDLFIKGASVMVKHRGDEPNYRDEVVASFARFRPDTTDKSSTKDALANDMNHVEARILDLVARLNPEPFKALDAHCRRYGQDAMDTGVRQFDREIQFYLAYADFMRDLKEAGLSFCYPTLSCNPHTIRANDTFDLALAAQCVTNHQPIPQVNDFTLINPERMILVSGPNQGGKTTFARAIGQLHYLARLGLPVPGTSADVLMCDNIYTHFEHEEAAEQSGTLANELARLKVTLDSASNQSVIILNEVFASTTLQDALFLGKKILEELISKNILTVVVTFITEWLELSPTIVSYGPTVSPDKPMVRTYRIVRRVPDGRSYAQTIQDKYNLSHDRIMERVRT